MPCKGTTLQHLAGGFFGTAIAVLVFSFLTRDPVIVFGACVFFGTVGWFHRQIYAGVGANAPEVVATWTAFRARRTTVEQKIGRLRMGVVLAFVPCAYALTIFALFKVDSIMSPWLPVAIWSLFLSLFSLILKQEWVDGPFAETNRQAERAQYERGRLYFVGRKLVEIIWIGSVFMVINVAKILYYWTVIALAILTGLGVMSVRLVRKCIYLGAKHAECGICVTTAVGVTAWVTVTYVPSSDDPVRAVWIAFLSGFLAAAASVVLAKGIVIFFESDHERKRLVTSQIVVTFNDEYAPQLARIFNIGWRFFYGQTRNVKRILPAAPRMRPMTLQLIPKPIVER